jgi:2-polyprenyl-3-methyl-5-hydroxy-6-metoxy-1,4-benzoquinol methylase
MVKNKRLISKKIICPACDNTHTDNWGKISFNNKAYSNTTCLHECLKCGLYFIYPSADEEALSKIYGGKYHSESNPIIDLIVKGYVFLTDYREDLELIKHYVKKGNVLDIGAGRGGLISLLSSSNYEKWIYDPFLSKDEIKKMSDKIPRINNYEKLSEYKNNYFDLIILRNVIEHTTSFRGLVKEIYKKLKKGGIIFIRTPNIGSVDFKIFKNDWYEVKMPGHMVFFGKKSMQNILGNDKFHILRIQASKRSMPLSLFRSIDVKIHPIFKLLFSLGFSLTSSFIGEGAELLAIAKK